MEFIKKLYIMTGRGQAKGAVTAERNGLGTFAEVSVYNLPPTSGKLYFAFISDRVRVFRLGARQRFELEKDARLSMAHAAVASADGNKLTLLLYGTDGGKRMWQENLCDMIRGKINEYEKTAMESGGSQDTRQETGTELLSLFPTGGGYDDNAVAKVNYYSNVYSSRAKTPAELVFERSRLEKLGDDLIRARLNVDEMCPPSDAESPVSADAPWKTEATDDTKERGRETRGQEYSDSGARADGKNVGQDGAARPAEREGAPRSRYADFIYSYRDRLLIEQKEVAASQKNVADAERQAPDSVNENFAGHNKAQEKPAPATVLGAAHSGAYHGENSAAEEAAAAAHSTPVMPYSAPLFTPGDADFSEDGEYKRQTDRGAEEAAAQPREAAKKDAPSDDETPAAPKADPAESQRLLELVKPEKLNFYERIKSQLERLFESNPRDETLEKLLPQSRFVRIAVENSDKYYCVGLIGKPDYICYAVPAPYTPEPPEELEGYCQWLPLHPEAPVGNGFWLIYQDAVTGDSVR